METIAQKAQGIVEYQEKLAGEVERLIAEVEALGKEYQTAKKERARLQSLELELKVLLFFCRLTIKCRVRRRVRYVWFLVRYDGDHHTVANLPYFMTAPTRGREERVR